MKKRIVSIVFLAILLLVPLSVAYAQTYSFRVPREVIDAYWESGGTLTLNYEIVFQNSANADPIDYVDIGLPNDNFFASDASATIDGQPVSDISESNYEGNGYGVGLYLGQDAIQPGRTGTIEFSITGVYGVLFEDNQDAAYASALFSPNYFGSQFVEGSSDITVIYHLPPGVKPAEPRYHQDADHPGFPKVPASGVDSQGRITYTWRNTDASASDNYLFGASFPKTYVAASSVTAPSFAQRYGIDPDVVIPLLVCLCFAGFFIAIIWFSIAADRRRRMQYLPPKISIEGHGIKRGLTAPEAAILLEQPMDKIMTMILFSVIKKDAAKVTKQDPLELELTSPRPADLREYETAFLDAFKEGDTPTRRRALQDMMVGLVKGVANKMRGFSKKESVEFYKKITTDAWTQVEGADTPKVQSKLFDDNLDWTMLDPDYDRRTRNVFSGGPVYVPYWYGNYNPTYRGSSVGGSRGGGSFTSRTTGGAGLPTLPGGDFAASMVGGVQHFAGGLIGNLSSFTGAVTKVTNPPPPPTRSSGGSFSGGGSSCACACAGCACACAGGGR
jgi:hypothetical protein